MKSKTKSVSHKFLVDVRERIGVLHNNISQRNKENERELFELKKLIDLKLYPPKKGYLRFETINGFVEFKSNKRKEGVSE